MFPDHLEQQNQGDERFKEQWLFTLKQLSDVGADAIPELCRELDQTQNDMMMRSMEFVLRAIDDQRAVPALIRVIPKTLLKPGADMSLQVGDEAIVKSGPEVITKSIANCYYPGLKT